MKRLAIGLGVVLLALAPVPGGAAGFHGGGGMRGGGGHGGGWHGGGFRGHGHGGHFHGGFGTRVFIGGFWDPFFFPGYYPYYAPYPYPYQYPYPAEGYPPDESGWGGAPEQAPPPGEREETQAEPAPSDESQRASYGLVQLRGVPDGASVDLDGRFWLSANDLDERWLALPDGEHTLRIQVGDAEPVVRHLHVGGGKNQVVRIGPLPRPRR